MKTVDPTRFGASAVFMNQRALHLLLTTVVGFCYDRPARLLHEPTVWEVAMEELGEDGLLDALNPRPGASS
ncbi:hypothetical protein WME73_18575 [Sorangium sp. So ce302]|uniref:hypothetical protein n=1 Tax=Sorangium sp. So ce302 TaxID=3133297 RepID=UPI003F64046B